MRKWVLLALLLGAGWWMLRPAAPAVWPGRPAAEEPRQEAGPLPAPWTRAGYTFVPLARFAVRAVVLSRERYYSGPDATLAPLDLALGWGPMSEAALINGLQISQGQRWFEWSCRGPAPLPPAEISRHSANMHLIPADPAVRSAVLAVRRHDLVEFSGFLVEVRGPDGWHWRSSLSRSDTGAGACEVVWVEQLERRRPAR